VLAGIEAVRTLKASGFRPNHEVWIVAWAEEEGSSTGLGLLGSRFYADLFSADEKLSIEDSLLRKESTFEFSQRSLATYQTFQNNVFAYLELHIEQGPVMVEQDVSLGVVDMITAVEGGSFQLEGLANHAGGTPMASRKDAATAAAQVILAVRDCAIEEGIRATCGQLDLSPNASNVIARYGKLSIDARCPNESQLDQYFEKLSREIVRIGENTGVEISYTRKYRLPSAVMDARLQALVASSARELGETHMTISSGAGHDAMALAAQVPTGMIFVPSEAGGVSHAPAEFTNGDLCASGANALVNVMAELAGDGLP
jgi:N-carbamoyl-L-amino-acid hydrolase